MALTEEEQEMLFEELRAARAQKVCPAKVGIPWFQWLPGWVPIVSAIIAAALYLGATVQRVNDRLDSLDQRLSLIENWIHAHSLVDVPNIGQVAPQQDAGSASPIHY